MRLALSLIAVSSLLLACGGGGGDSPTGLPAGEPLALSSSNYVTVAQEALSSSSYVVDASSLATGVQTADTQVLIDFAQAQAARLGGWFGQSTPLATGVTQSGTEACSGGGTLSVSVTDANNSGTPDAGDSASVTASNCSLDGITYNGSFSLLINSLSGDLINPPYAAAFTLGFNNLSAQSAAATTSGSGQVSLSVNAVSASEGSVSLAASSFSQTSVFGGTTYQRTLTSYQAYSNFTSLATTTSVNGTVTSSALGGRSVSLATTTPFVRASGALYPAVGQATATGASGGRVRISALDGSTVLIELDANGDGSYEESTTRLWSSLV